MRTVGGFTTWGKPGDAVFFNDYKMNVSTVLEKDIPGLSTGKRLLKKFITLRGTESIYEFSKVNIIRKDRLGHEVRRIWSKV